MWGNTHDTGAYRLESYSDAFRLRWNEWENARDLGGYAGPNDFDAVYAVQNIMSAVRRWVRKFLSNDARRGHWGKDRCIEKEKAE